MCKAKRRCVGMYDSVKKYAAILLMLIGLAILLPATSVADGIDTRFYVSCGEVVTYDGVPVNIIYPYKVKDKYYLFLPGGWDASRLTFHYGKDTPLFVGGAQLEDGMITDCFVPGQRTVLLNRKGGKAMTLNVMQGSPIPSLFLINETGNMNRINRDKHLEETGAMVFMDETGGMLTRRLTQLKGRGNATAGFAKEGYQMKLDKKADLLDSGKAKTYILLADYLDWSLLRNRVSLDMARYAGLRFALDCQSIDLYCNGRYFGVFLLTEKIQVGPGRVDIVNLEDATLKVNEGSVSGAARFKVQSSNTQFMMKAYEIEKDPADITGGYILEIEKPYRLRDNETNGFQTDKRLSFVIKEPTYASRAQAEYISCLVNRFHNAVLSRDGRDPETGVHYTELADLDSLCLKYLLEEIIKNVDANASSQFFYKDSDSVDPKLYAGPAWDYDLSLGNSNLGQTAANGLYLSKMARPNYLYGNLYRHADFEKRVKELYFERYAPAIETLLGLREPEDGQALLPLEAYKAQINASARMNFTIWGPKVPGMNTAAAGSFDKGVAFVEKFFKGRYVYLNKAWEN